MARRARPDSEERSRKLWQARAEAEGYACEAAMFAGFVAKGLTLADMAAKFVNPRTGKPLCPEAIGRRIRAKHMHLRVGRQGWISEPTVSPNSKFFGLPEKSQAACRRFSAPELANKYPVGGRSGLPLCQGV